MEIFTVVYRTKLSAIRSEKVAYYKILEYLLQAFSVKRYEFSFLKLCREADKWYPRPVTISLNCKALPL
jgi:hypothetical protein